MEAEVSVQNSGSTPLLAELAKDLVRLWLLI